MCNRLRYTYIHVPFYPMASVIFLYVWITGIGGLCYTDTFPGPNPGDNDYVDEGSAQESELLSITKKPHTQMCFCYRNPNHRLKNCCILNTVIIPRNPCIWFLKPKTNCLSTKTNTPVWNLPRLSHCVAIQAIKR